MPVEIREIIIKATVSEGEQASTGPTANPSSGSVAAGSSLQDAIEQVMQILEDKKQR